MLLRRSNIWDLRAPAEQHLLNYLCSRKIKIRGVIIKQLMLLCVNLPSPCINNGVVQPPAAVLLLLKRMIWGERDHANVLRRGLTPLQDIDLLINCPDTTGFC